MTEIDYLLVTLMEECAEVTQCLSKILRFGQGDRYPLPTSPDNFDKLKGEVIDLLALIEMLEERGVKLRITGPEMHKAMEAKKRKVLHYMQYSQARGRLETDNATAIQRLHLAVHDFVYNVRAHNVVGGADVEADESFKELRAAMLCCRPSTESKATPGDTTPATGEITSTPGGPI